VRTDFASSERLRSVADRAEARGVVPWTAYTRGEAVQTGADSAQAIDPETVGPMVVDAIVQDRPYVLTHPLPEHVTERARLLGAAATGR
jgi:hypothetical protein